MTEILGHDELLLPEKILLIALRDEEGTVSWQASYFEYALGGALIAELLLRGRIRVVEQGRRKEVRCVERKPVGHTLLDECLAQIADSDKVRDLNHWVSAFVGIRHLKQRVAEHLCERGILKTEKEKILFLFSRTVYPEMDHVPEQHLIGRLREAILGTSTQVDARTAVLVSLASEAGLLSIPLTKAELQQGKERIEGMKQGDLIGEATADVIQAAMAAMMVASMVPVWTATVNS